jgi:curved DNA-binding protein CbpA
LGCGLATRYGYDGREALVSNAHPTVTQQPDEAFSAEEEATLAEEVDLDPDFRKAVLAMHRKLDQLDHYALLGVSRDADRKVLKRAYFELAARFHPDRYFRKKLGSFKQKMEVIFGRITLAQETLGNGDRRSEYDAYLAERQRSRGIEELLADAMAEVARAQESVERAANEVPAGAAAAPPPPAADGPGPAPVKTGTSSGSRPVDPAIRREALARKLLGGRSPSQASFPPVAGTSKPPQAATPAPTPQEAMDALRRRYELRKEQAQASQARKYVTNAETAFAAGDVVTAANNFRVAASLLPGDAEVSRRAAEVQQRADGVLAETYLKQAGYEEKNGQWAEAARSWARVVKARPGDATANERAAHALLKAGGDLHEASRLAKAACALEPKSAAFRVTLANVYLAANLGLNARRELETAAQLAPHDDTIQAMLKRVAK